MHQYSNYAYTSGVPGSQKVAAYSARQSAASASHNPCVLATDDAAVRHAEGAETSVLTSPACRRPTPAGASTLSADSVPPPPTTTRLASPPPADIPTVPEPSRAYATPLDRVALRVYADICDDDETTQQHARSHSAPAAPRRRPPTVHHNPSGPPNCRSPPAALYAQPTSLREKNADDERTSPAPSPAAHHPTATNIRCRRTFPVSFDSEPNGPVADAYDTSPSTRQPNSVSLPAAGSGAGCDQILTRRRLRATRGRLNYLLAAGDCAVGGTVASAALVAGVAVVFSAVASLLLLRLTARDETTHVGDSLLPSDGGSGGDGGTTLTRTVVKKVAVALAATTVALDLCSLLTVLTQCFFAVKLAHGRHAETRVSGYLEKCSVTRMIASGGLFLSIPIFLLALMLYAILEYTLTSAITCVVIFTVAIVYITITAAHSIHCWNVQKSRTSNSVESTSTVKSPSLVLPLAVSKQTLNSDDSALSQVKLSTLV